MGPLSSKTLRDRMILGRPHVESGVLNKVRTPEYNPTGLSIRSAWNRGAPERGKKRKPTTLVYGANKRRNTEAIEAARGPMRSGDSAKKKKTLRERERRREKEGGREKREQEKKEQAKSDTKAEGDKS